MNFNIEKRSQTFWCHCQPQRILLQEKNNKAKPKKNRKALFGTDRNEMVCVVSYKGKRKTSQKISSIFPYIFAEKENRKKLLTFHCSLLS